MVRDKLLYKAMDLNGFLTQGIAWQHQVYAGAGSLAELLKSVRKYGEGKLNF